MKKIQVLFAVLAVFVASAGVFGNKLFTTTYYWSESGTVNAGACVNTIALPCDDLGTERCTTTVNPGEGPITVFVNKKIDSGNCQEVHRSTM